jgi:uncharacterized protein (TIRG00374 family)
MQANPFTRRARKDAVVKKQYLLNALKYTLGIELLAYVILDHWPGSPDGKVPGLAETLSKPIQWTPLALAALVYLVGLLFTFYRWYVLVRAQDLPFTKLNALRLGLIGFFLSVFLPGSIGGDIIKAVFIAREQDRRTVAVSTVLIDRAVGLWGLIWLVFLIGGISWLFGNQAVSSEKYLQLIILVATVVVVVTMALWMILRVLPDRRAKIFAGRLSRIPKVGHAASEFWGAIWMYRCKAQSVAFTVLLSVVGHVFFVLSFFLAAHVFQEPGVAAPIPSLTQHFLLVPIGLTMQAIIPIPGGLGVGEAVFGWLYTLVGKPATAGVTAMIAQRLIIWGWSFAGYLVFLRMRPALGPMTEASADLAAA